MAAAANAIGQCGGTLRSIERVNSQVRTSAQYHHRECGGTLRSIERVNSQVRTLAQYRRMSCRGGALMRAAPCMFGSAHTSC